MKIVMIHEITSGVLKKDLSDFDIITFDDGLYTQYKNIEHFLKFKKPLYFSISTSIVCPENIEQSDEIIYCGDAHKKAFKGNFENYMTWKQIQEISYISGCHISGHCNEHKRIKTFKEGIKDIKIMQQKFKEYNIKIEAFCYPYNYETPFVTYPVKAAGISQFFGKERIAIENI